MTRRLLVALAGVAGIVVAFVLIRGGDGDEATPATTRATTTAAAPAGTTVRFVVRDGKVVGGPQVHDVPFEKRVTLVVVSDTPGQLHVHGYELTRDVSPGAPTRLTFFTRLSGRFEVELHEAEISLGELSILPS